MCSARSRRRAGSVERLTRRSFLGLLRFRLRFWPEAHVMQRHADDPGNHPEIADPLERTLPQADHPGHARILGQTAVALRMVDVVQHVNHVRAADTRWI